MQLRAVPFRTLLVLLVLLAAAPSLVAQRANHVRVYRAAGTYSAAVSFAPAGSVISRSGDTPQVTILDGFDRRDLAVPEESHMRVYQSRSGQLWTVAQEGLFLYHGGQWSLHIIPDIRNELASNVRPLRQISLVPAEVNRVLILLPDRLLDYEASSQALRTLRFASQSSIGAFTEMQEGADEAVWVAGLQGVARISGPLRRIASESEWTEFPLTATNEVSNLQRPFENPPGHVTVSANRLDADGRYVLQLDGRGWSQFPVTEEKIRQAWTGWDETTWGFSFNSLFRFGDRQEASLIREPVFGRQYDVAVEPGGAFWVAASEGLIRYAPFLWHSPRNLESLQVPVHALLFETGVPTNVWLSLPEGLMLASGSQLQTFPWPEELEAIGGPSGRLFSLPEGRVLVASPGRPMIFSPLTRAFQSLPPTLGTNLHFVGDLPNHRVAAWKENAAEKLSLYSYDGTNLTEIALPPISWTFGEVSFFEQTPAGEIWIGGLSGLVQVRTNKTEVLHGPDSGLTAERIFSLAVLGDGRVWCGTDSRVYELRGQRWHPILNTIDRVHAILRLPDAIWVGTPAGVYRYIADSWMFHGANEGLASPPIFTLRRDGFDHLWAGTGRGVVMFHSEADPDPPRTLSPSLQEASQPSTLEPTVVRFFGQDKWDYTAPGDLLYAYKLDETPWTPFSNVATRVFQNLSSGSHTLQVLAMDRNGNRSLAPSQIAFNVIVPWFKDPRLLFVSAFAGLLTIVLAGLAVNKHLQLKRSYAEVEQIVALRTRELERANRELLHGQKMRAIGTMAAGIAHDFNNILSIIKGSAQIIEGNPADKEKIRTRVNRIQTVVEQGTTIVKALLGLGRMSEKDLAPCDIPALLHETRRLLTDRFPEQVRFHIEAPSDLPLTVCAQEVLQQMLLNLILNAVDAMAGEGRVRLSARLSVTLPSGLVLDPAESSSHIIVSVDDEGIGIAEENLPRIFEPFFTTKAFSSRRGTGLGLSMVYELAKGFGYGLGVSTRPGEGSSFSIILPVTQASEGGPDWRQSESNAGISNS